MIKIIIDEEKCIGSRICRDLCPKGPRIWGFKKENERRLCTVIDPSFCLNCRICVTRCPVKAVTVRL
ncbi:MAG: ferredoxin family protein [Candidatus Hydrothermarchaeales archaeon]